MRNSYSCVVANVYLVRSI